MPAHGGGPGPVIDWGLLSWRGTGVVTVLPLSSLPLARVLYLCDAGLGGWVGNALCCCGPRNNTCHMAMATGSHSLNVKYFYKIAQREMNPNTALTGC